MLVVTKWKLQCTECGRVWIFKGSFDLESMGRIYHYCPYCKRNTFHIVLGRVDDPNDSGADGVEEASNLLEEAREA